jgi:hypothetical protein
LPAGLSREFELVAACCVWPPSPERDFAVVAAASGAIDWPLAARIACRQRVEGLVQASLARAKVKLPAGVVEALAGRARDIARRALAQGAESLRLQGLLADSQIASLVLKGAATEVLAYGELGRKDAWDIDLLVSPVDVARATQVLHAAGYEIVQPRNLSADQFTLYVALARECEFFDLRSGLTVELHWSLADGPVLLPEISVGSPSQTVALSHDRRLRTLARPELFAYLCVHGAMHGWSRLKWLADLAALLGKENPQSLEQLYRRSLGFGVGLCSAQALLLCRRLLDTPIAPDLAAELEGLPGASWLVSAALDTMAGGGAREVDSRPFVTARILLMQLVLCGSWRGAASQMRYRAVSVHDRVVTPLPKGLEFLYPFVRAPLWLWRRLAGARL